MKINLEELPEQLIKELNLNNFFENTDRGRIFTIIKENNKISINEILINFYKKYNKILKRNTLNSHIVQLKKKGLIY